MPQAGSGLEWSGYPRNGPESSDPMRVLVAEDNPDMGPYLEQGLCEHGFAVDLVTDGIRAYEYAATGVYDLLILDRMLPGRDGLDVLRRLRAGQIRTPAIF